MSVRDRLSRIFGRGSVPAPDPRLFAYPFPPVTADGYALTPSDALQLSVVWAAVSVIARAVASCEWKVYERSGASLTWKDEDSLDWILNTRPNPDTTAMAVKEALMYSALIYGDGYLEIVKDGAGKIAELWPLDPERVVPFREEAGAPLAYKVQAQKGQQYTLAAERVFHLRGPSLTGFVGDNMVLRAAKTLTLNQAADAFATSYYRNSTVIGGVLEYEKGLDAKSLERLEQSWGAKRSGPSKAFGVKVLENGMKWKPLTSDAGTSQMLEARKFQVEEVARWWSVPLHMLGSLAGSQGYGTNLETLGADFARNCIQPWARRIENEADVRLITTRGPNSRRVIRIDLSPLARPDTKTRAESWAILRNIGVVSVNDILRAEGQNVIGPEGDLRVVQAGFVPLDSIEEKAEAELEKLTAPPPAPVAPAGETTDATDTEDDTEEIETPEAVARAAAGVFYGQALERHRARVAKGMDPEKSQAKLQTDCDAAVGFLARAGLKGPNGALSKCAAAVLVGQPPETAAELLAGSLESA